MVGVYKITNTKNGKVYIGQSVDVKKRFNEHKRGLRNNDHINCYLQDDWNVYGEESFSFEVIMKCRSIKLNEIEKQFIKEYDSTNRDKGYNISAGWGRTLIAPTRRLKYSDTKYRAHIKCYERDTSNYAYFKNSEGKMEYNSLCVGCERECKQSFRAEILICPHLEKH